MKLYYVVDGVPWLKEWVGFACMAIGGLLTVAPWVGELLMQWWWER